MSRGEGKEKKEGRCDRYVSSSSKDDLQKSGASNLALGPRRRLAPTGTRDQSRRQRARKERPGLHQTEGMADSSAATWSDISLKSA